ncbi:Sigma-70 family RNA polymerase sigma factor OS=Streptomyces fumanus OX=67302 GN=GCM10018772_62110 PE=3 SV=1 [Streptomyces fumanus]
MNRAHIGALVKSAADGDKAAWDALVTEFSSLVWSVIRAHDLSDAESHGVYQEVWFRFIVAMKALPEPRDAGVWLAGTTRQECLEALRYPSHDASKLHDWVDWVNVEARAKSRPEGVAVTVGEAERIRILWEEFEQLGARCRQLLRTLMASPPPTYQEVAAGLGIAVNSIGPLRQRCLRRLRARLKERGGLDSRGAPNTADIPGLPTPRASITSHAFGTGDQSQTGVTAGGAVEPSLATGREKPLTDSSKLPGCQAQLTLLDDDPRAGTPVRLAVKLVVEAAHPWARSSGVRPLLDIVATPLSSADVVPDMVMYRLQGTDSAQFRVTAMRPGAHRIRFTFLHHDTGVALQQVETELDIAASGPMGREDMRPELPEGRS